MVDELTAYFSIEVLIIYWIGVYKIVFLVEVSFFSDLVFSIIASKPQKLVAIV